jgi:hypothetical protein
MEVPGADSLLFLQDTAQANLAHMGDRVEQEVVMCVCPGLRLREFKL